MDLFDPTPDAPTVQMLAPGALLLPGFACDAATGILEDIAQITAVAPFRHQVTPGGFTMSVAMSNCGSLGWVTDRRGYRYQPVDPQTGQPWPPMPARFAALAARAARVSGFSGFVPDACLINRYAPGARMGLHQDRDEQDFTQPIVSVSLGVPAVFLFGGPARTDKPQRVPLAHGDVVVWGASSRLHFHGVQPLKPSRHPLLGEQRINLTFRKAR